MKKLEGYKVLAYIGGYELSNEGVFDTFYGAQEKLLECLNVQLQDVEESDIEEIEENFYFNSRIEEVDEIILDENEMLEILKENRIQIIDLLEENEVYYKNDRYSVLNILNGKSWNYSNIEEIYNSFLDGDMN
ncbi:MAG: hypothetical protein ACRCYT_01195 [Cetobacterium sp.]